LSLTQPNAMASRAERIAIAGAGIGGLAAAIALARRGISSHVFERRTGPDEAGAGIQIGPNGCKVLADLGALEHVRAHACEPDALSVHDGSSGRVLTRLPLGTWMRERYNAPYLTLHRQDLHKALLECANDISIISGATGQDVATFATGDDGTAIFLSSGEEFKASALIAADGLWSRLRTQVTPSEPPQPFEKCAYRTVVPREALPQELTANDVHIWLSPGAHVVHYPVRAGAEIAVVVIVDATAAENAWNIDATPDWPATAATLQLAPALLELLGQAEHWRMWSLQTLEPLERWTTGSVALLGDAAHPVLPFFASGASLALEDASVLAAALSETSAPMPARLQAYEIARRARVQRVANASLMNGRIYHLGGKLAAARNLTLTRVPPALLMRRYDWLYGWKPSPLPLGRGPATNAAKNQG
jgi:salicylate hydroxylase